MTFCRTAGLNGGVHSQREKPTCASGAIASDSRGSVRSAVAKSRRQPATSAAAVWAGKNERGSVLLSAHCHSPQTLGSFSSWIWSGGRPSGGSGRARTNVR